MSMKRTFQDVVKQFTGHRFQNNDKIEKLSNFRMRQRYRHGYGYGYPHSKTSEVINVARFAMLSIIGLPLTLSVGSFTYTYLYRVELCKKSISNTLADEDIIGSYQGPCIGRDRELNEARSLLQEDPNKIVVLAGPNEVGKSRFLADLLHNRERVTVISASQFVDSVSSFTQVFVNAFGLRWLQLRHMLVDLLPVAGSEIMVLKERFSDRDLEQSLLVITEALKEVAASPSSAKKPKPVIVIDGFGEGDKTWMQTREFDICLQRLLKWCVYLTKERHLAHIILVGNENFMLNLMGHVRETRGHLKVIGLQYVQPADASKFVESELPGATPGEVKKLTGTFGGCIHDLQTAIEDIRPRLADVPADTEENKKIRLRVLDEVIKARIQNQVERVVAAFAKAAEDNDLDEADDENQDADEEEGDNFLDPLKAVYSERQADAKTAGKMNEKKSATWTQLQLWQTIRRIVDSDRMAVNFGDLRDDIFAGDGDPICDLMSEDVLGFEVMNSSDGSTSWGVTPATPALGRAFRQLLSLGDLNERFEAMKTDLEIKERLKEAESERRDLMRDRRSRELRKSSLLRTIELGAKFGREDYARARLGVLYDEIVNEEAEHLARELNFLNKIRSLKRKFTISEPAASGGVIAEEEIGKLTKKPTLRQSTSDLLNLAILKLLARQDPALENLKDADKLSRLEIAFCELDLSNTGKLTVDDVANAIAAASGGEVDKEAVKKLVDAWDKDDDGMLDYGEFVEMLGVDNIENAQGVQQKS